MARALMRFWEKNRSMRLNSTHKTIISNGPIDENDSAIVRLANQIIVDAYRLEASDIHIEPYSDKKETVVRFRVDGTCFKYMTIPPTYRRAIVSRFKIMARSGYFRAP